MSHKEQIEITPRDRVLRAWENSMELVRDFQNYANEMDGDDQEVADVFSEFAEDEGQHASKFREILHGYQDKRDYQGQ